MSSTQHKLLIAFNLRLPLPLPQGVKEPRRRRVTGTEKHPGDVEWGNVVYTRIAPF